MIRLLAAAALSLAGAVAAPCPAQDRPAITAEPDPERLALATRIVDLSYPPASRIAMLARAAEAMTAQMRAGLIETLGGRMDAGLQRLFDRYLERTQSRSERLIAEHSPPLFVAFARAYARKFSHAELEAILAFVSTPTGARFVAESAELLLDPDVARANTTYMANVFIALQPMMEEFRNEVRAYLAAPR